MNRSCVGLYFVCCGGAGGSSRGWELGNLANECRLEKGSVLVISRTQMRSNGSQKRAGDLRLVGGQIILEGNLFGPQIIIKDIINYAGPKLATEEWQGREKVRDEELVGTSTGVASRSVYIKKWRRLMRGGVRAYRTK
jgi:hypothetical protein